MCLVFRDVLESSNAMYLGISLKSNKSKIDALSDKRFEKVKDGNTNGKAALKHFTMNSTY